MKKHKRPQINASEWPSHLITLGRKQVLENGVVILFVYDTERGDTYEVEIVQDKD